MVLMLELVGIGVFGACLSALLCIITEGTPYEVPKVISFKQGLLRPRIIRSLNWPQWKSGIICKEKGRRHIFRQKINEPIGLGPQRLLSQVPQSYGEHLRTSVDNLERCSQTIVTKAVDNMKGYWKEDDKLSSSPSAVKEDSKYNGNIEKFKYAQSVKSNENKTRLMVKMSVDKIKTALVTNKNEESCAESNSKQHLHESEWRKVSTKKRRFILPKNLIIANESNNAHSEKAVKADPFEKSTDREFQSNERYCYLEALRIKRNKAENIV